MWNRRSIIRVVAVLVVSTVMSNCQPGKNVVSDSLFEKQTATALYFIDLTATAQVGTQTAQAFITPTVTPTILVLSVPTDEPAPPSPWGNLILQQEDPEGDTDLCGNTVSDLWADIFLIEVFDPIDPIDPTDPTGLGPLPFFPVIDPPFQPPEGYWDPPGYVVSMQLGAPADECLEHDSCAVKGEFYDEAMTPVAFSLIEGDLDNFKVGRCTNATCRAITPGTEGFVSVDAQGRVIFLAPFNTRFMAFSSFHLETIGLTTSCDEVPLFEIVPPPP